MKHNLTAFSSGLQPKSLQTRHLSKVEGVLKHTVTAGSGLNKIPGLHYLHIIKKKLYLLQQQGKKKKKAAPNNTKA